MQTMNPKDDEGIRAAVRDHYSSVVKAASKDQHKPDPTHVECCQPSCCEQSVPTPKEEECCAPSCCDGTSSSLKIGYSTEDISNAPDGADLGLGCGNPQAIASLRPGEIVLDLGSGAGFDAFLAASQVGPNGKVIGVDMTPPMVERARKNAAKAGFQNVEFRLGEIEHLPVADASIDVIISNCVINLSPNKPAVFAEAFRVLKPGGRLAISDVIATKPLPDTLSKSIAAHACCISGASEIAELQSILSGSGFLDVRININEQSHRFIRDWMPGSGAEEYIASATLEAHKSE
jgi:SAM-dependent methyltransferase